VWTGNDDVTPSSGLVYSYQLEGVDAAPSAFGPGTSQTYTGLTDGATYTFSVQARDAAGNVDATAARRTFTVSIPAPDQRYVDSDVAFDMTSTDNCQRIQGQGSVTFTFPEGQNAGATAEITQTLVLSTAPGASCTDARNMTLGGTQSAALSVNGNAVSVTAGPIAFSGTKTPSAITGSATVTVSLDGRTFPTTIVEITAQLQ
jgi:chitodextrinase